jgi:hypothetical protein
VAHASAVPLRLIEGGLHTGWSPAQFDELLAVLKSIEEGRGSVSVRGAQVCILAGYGVRITFHQDGSVEMGDGYVKVSNHVRYAGTYHDGIGPNDSPSYLFNVLGLLLESVADGHGFIETSRTHGLVYADTYGSWAVFYADGTIEFDRHSAPQR